jgi:hypothetical protein
MTQLVYRAPTSATSKVVYLAQAPTGGATTFFIVLTATQAQVASLGHIRGRFKPEDVSQGVIPTYAMQIARLGICETTQAQVASLTLIKHTGGTTFNKTLSVTQAQVASAKGYASVHQLIASQAQVGSLARARIANIAARTQAQVPTLQFVVTHQTKTLSLVFKNNPVSGQPVQVTGLTAIWYENGVETYRQTGLSTDAAGNFSWTIVTAQASGYVGKLVVTNEDGTARQVGGLNFGGYVALQ